jgi:hypothetical protein
MTARFALAGLKWVQSDARLIVRSLNYLEVLGGVLTLAISGALAYACYLGWRHFETAWLS